MSEGGKVRRKFKARPGSKYIASAHAVDGLVKWLRRVRPKTVLEVGAGIGTLTSVLIKYLDEIHGPGNYRIVSIENNPFCLAEFKNNIGSDLEKVTVADRYESIPSGIAPFDFIIIDGFGPYAVDGDHDNDFIVVQNKLYASELSPHGIVFVEKDRQWQRDKVVFSLAERPFAYCHYHPWRVRPGYHIYWFEATHSEGRELACSHFVGDLNRGAMNVARRMKRAGKLLRIQRESRPPDY